MSAIIPLTAGASLPAYLAQRKVLAAINADLLPSGSGFPVMSIKGKVFALVKDGERKVLTRADDPDEVLQNVEMTVVRANPKSRVFYMKAYVEGSEGEAAKPDCYSSDGVSPGADARNPQAKKCSLCPHSVWGSKKSTDGGEGKGTACTVNTRLAVVDPHSLAKGEFEPFLLRLPAGSRTNFADIVKAADARGIPYNALVIKTGFDKEAPSPKLTFKLVGLLDDAAFEKVSKAFEDEVVKDIVGLGPVREALPAPGAAPTATESDLEAALASKAARERAAAEAAAKQAVERAAAKPAPAATEEDLDSMLAGVSAAAAAPAEPKPEVTDVEPKPARKTRAAAAPAPTPAPEAKVDRPTDYDGLLDGLDSLLGNPDD